MNEQSKPERLLVVPWWAKTFIWVFAGPPALVACALAAVIWGAAVGAISGVNMVNYLSGRQ